MRVLRHIEKGLLILGVLALSVFAALHFHGILASRRALEEFQQIGQQHPREVSRGLRVPKPEIVDFSLWSETRVRRYREILTTYSAPPAAVLKIPEIHLEVPVFDGTDELTLNRGVGRIPGTAKCGQNGNIGIAGHRDGFFRGLSRIEIGNSVYLLTSDQTREYVVEEVSIVMPDDVSVLKSTRIPSLTLVTCYPFYFVGDAPKRWIVRCALKSSPLENPSQDKASMTQNP
jgi:sortase A